MSAVIADGVLAAEAAATEAAFPPRILNMTTPQVGHLPLMALRPFFMVSSSPFAISFLALHLTQYPSGIKISFRKRTSALLTWGLVYKSRGERVNM